MATARSTPAWIRRWLRRAPEPASDWADLGTAFGLDGALGPAGADSAPTSTVDPTRSPRGWWPRRGGNRSASGG